MAISETVRTATGNAVMVLRESAQALESALVADDDEALAQALIDAAEAMRLLADLIETKWRAN